VAHQPKPFYRYARKAFFVQLGTQQIKLVAGPNDTATEKAAGARVPQPDGRTCGERECSPQISRKSGRRPHGGVFEKFLDWCEKHRSPRTDEWSRNHIQTFCDHLKTARTKPAADLRPFHVVEWVDSKETWGANQKRGAIVAVTRPFNWAAKLGYIAASPVRGVENLG
jgi:hypothetical protein